ncbi:hypothetical protein [Nocardioides sp. AE5]|uniref:hypothetical protein n=1 Tax=Nocardioides sp. AE5 TaxID=2962573 RepID=UPI00288278CE|nr:hypothetical protein [Nocardioides sp. AE5]MDT0202041.1 hypothetical protein [Nocardioides sp. AE5]
MLLVDELRRRYAALGTRRVVWICAVAAVLLHFPALMWPLGPDESGYTLVGRHWDPGPGSLYGDYWVDRPPLLVLLYRWADLVGGPYFLRLVAAVGCGWLVVVAARTAYLVNGARAARWTAVVATALTSTTLIDPVQAKGEVLGIPIVMTSILLSVEALAALGLGSGQERAPRRLRAVALAAGAGFFATLVLGMKQNMVTGLVFGGVLLLTSVVVGRLSRGDFLRLTAAALLGAAVPIVATLGWCLAAGVGLDELAYAVFGFRSDALEVIGSQMLGNSKKRAVIITLFFVLTGMALFMVLLATRLREAWRAHPGITAATCAVIAVDGASLGLSGSFWSPYLHLLTPATLLAVLLLAGASETAYTWARRSVGFAVASAAAGLVVWVGQNAVGFTSPQAYATGEAIEAAAQRGDTIMVHGGRADIVMGANLAAPYPYLWSLPMRALDGDRTQMVEHLTGEDRVTWFVEWIPLDEWTSEGTIDLEVALDLGYVRHGSACGGAPVYLRNDVERADLAPECGSPWRMWDRLLD